MKNFYERYWQHFNNKRSKDSYQADFSYKWPAISKFIPNESQTILDFGCGNGTVLKNLRKISPDSDFIGVDISGEAITQARKKNPDVKFFRVDDGNKIPLKSKSVDFVFAGDVVEHVYDTETMFNEFYRILKNGGKILITTPYYGLIKTLIIVLVNFDLVFDPKGPHIRFFTKKSLLSALKIVGFKINKFGYFGRSHLGQPI